MSKKEPTHYDILEAINGYATQNDQRLDRIESEIGGMKSEIGGMKSEIGSLNSRVGNIESKMVTKDYLDEKLMDLRGDLIVVIRKEDTKLTKLVNILDRRKVISKTDARTVLCLEPFPKSSA